MAICKSCGAKLKPNEKFCLECGTEVDEIVTEDEESPKPESKPSCQDNNNGGMAINIVKPKDISVLKKNVPPPPKKISQRPAAPAPVQKSSEPQTEQLRSAPVSYKREVPDIELPEDNRYFAPTYVEGEPPPVAHYMQNKREDDFTKGFYSDSSVNKKGVQGSDAASRYAEQKKKEQKEIRKERIKNRTLYFLTVLLLLIVIAYCFYRFGLLSRLLNM